MASLYTPLRDQVRELLPCQANGYVYTEGTNSLAGPASVLVIPVSDYEEIDFNPQGYLIQHFAQWKPVGGSFERAHAI